MNDPYQVRPGTLATLEVVAAAIMIAIVAVVMLGKLWGVL